MAATLTVTNKNHLRTSAILFGVGMGGFFDGILFHQILQIHNMLSNRFFPDTIENTDLNMFWDGLFHAFTWTVTAAGIYFFWKAAQTKNKYWSAKTLMGGMFLGWGLFNFIEGIIDHHVLEVHHVVQRTTGTTQLLWDLAFLASGMAFTGLGVFLLKIGKEEEKLLNAPIQQAILKETEQPLSH